MSEQATQQQQELFDDYSADRAVLRDLSKMLPALPSVLRYYDEFEDTVRSIKNPAALTVFEISAFGKKFYVDFARLGEECSVIFKHIFAYILTQNLAIISAVGYLSAAQHLKSADVVALVKAGPTKIGPVWKALRARELPSGTYVCAKYVLHLLCALRLCGWSDEYQMYLKNALPLPAKDKYAGVRSGDVFLSVDEEATLVRHLDDTVAKLTAFGEASLSHDEIVDAAMLLCSFMSKVRAHLGDAHCAFFFHRLHASNYSTWLKLYDAGSACRSVPSNFFEWFSSCGIVSTAQPGWRSVQVRSRTDSMPPTASCTRWKPRRPRAQRAR
jgi:hypothetical protein